VKAKRILCPIDFSESSAPLIRFVHSIATEDATVFFLHAFKSYEASGSHFSPEQVEQERCIELKQLLEILPPSFNRTTECIVEFGHPAETIIKYACENEIDLIVIATHGRTGLDRLLLGSTAEAVMRQATCPVMAIKTALIQSASAESAANRKT
jgi:nucleotide-binding universal stress UspA family protein